MNNPFVSIIIPTYNRKDFIVRTIDSTLRQSLKDFEIIVVDDGSTDQTETYLKQNYGSKIRFIRIPNSERGKARNAGTLIAKGQYVYFLDSDDILYPRHLEEAFSFIQKSKSPEWIFQEYEIQQGSKIIPIQYDRKNPLKTLVIKGNFMSCHGVFLRYDIAKNHPFEENRQMAGSEDYALWLKLAARYPLHINPTVTSALIEHDDRSVFNFAPDLLIQRKKLMLKTILEDREFLARFTKFIPSLKANTYSYISLHLAMINSKQKSIAYLFKSLKANPGSILSRRTLAILKHLMR